MSRLTKTGYAKAMRRGEQSKHSLVTMTSIPAISPCDYHFLGSILQASQPRIILGANRISEILEGLWRC
jgi:hypothetical protein